MKTVKKVNEYLSNLAVLNVKLHNIHWNVEGKQFVRVHNFTEEIYDAMFEKYDEIAEMLKMKEEKPLVTMKDYLENASVEESDKDVFSVQESLEMLKKDLELMKKLATEIRNEADEENDFETVAIFEDHVAFYSLNIWFTKAMLG